MNDIIDITNESYDLGNLYEDEPNESCCPEKAEDKYSNRFLEETNSRETYDNEYWKFGSRYKEKLRLSDTEVNLLNKLWNPGNNFCDIEACRTEVVKLYVKLFRFLDEEFINEGVTREQVFNYIAAIYVKKQYSYHKGSVNYIYSIEETKRYFYQNIFKHCENAIRDIYGHKRKLNTDLSLHISEANNKYKERVIPLLEKTIPSLAQKIVKKPNSATEKELNALNTTRWKTKFDDIAKKFTGDFKQFKNEIVSLGILNEKNPSIELIFYEASKFISRYHRETALTLYIYYLHYDLRSESFDNRELTKTIQKNIFASNEQLHDFQAVVSRYIQDRDLFNALRAIPALFEAKRKKIVVNRNVIETVEYRHSETVALLNEYLRDEFENDDLIIQSSQVNEEIVEIKIKDKKGEITAEIKNIYSSDIELSDSQILTLSFFAKNNLSVSVEDLKSYAKENGLFARQVIDSINENCYELLDDVLIEEEDEYYVITEDYYQIILAS